MHSTSILSLVPATSSEVDRASSAPEPYPEACEFCLEEWNDHPDEGVDEGSVRFDGWIACGFHAMFMWFDEPARVYREVEVEWSSLS
jgi:hypothetical protein